MFYRSIFNFAINKALYKGGGNMIKSMLPWSLNRHSDLKKFSSKKVSILVKFEFQSVNN